MPSDSHRLSLAAGALAAALLAAPLGAGERKAAQPAVDIHVEDEDGARVHLTLASGWLSGWLDSIHVACRTDADSQAREMMAKLETGGEGSVFEYRDADDGARVVGRRTRGQIVIEKHERDGGRATVEMPWPAARCLMLGIAPDGELGREIASGEARLRIDVRDHGDRVRIAVE